MQYLARAPVRHSALSVQVFLRRVPGGCLAVVKEQCRRLQLGDLAPDSFQMCLHIVSGHRDLVGLQQVALLQIFVGLPLERLS